MVTLLFDVVIEGNPLAEGERVSLSRSLERYLVGEGAAVFETATIDLTKLEKRDNFNNDTNSPGGQLPKPNGGKKLSKGRSKRGR
jgi:hypothetical protein